MMANGTEYLKASNRHIGHGRDTSLHAQLVFRRLVIFVLVVDILLVGHPTILTESRSGSVVIPVPLNMLPGGFGNPGFHAVLRESFPGGNAVKETSRAIPPFDCVARSGSVRIRQ